MPPTPRLLSAILSASCLPCARGCEGPGGGSPGASSRSNSWDNALVEKVAVWGMAVSKRYLVSSPPVEGPSTSPPSVVGSTDWGNKLSKRHQVAALALRLGSGALERTALPSLAFLSELNLVYQLYSLYSLTLHASQTGPRGSWLPTDTAQGFH